MTNSASELLAHAGFVRALARHLVAPHLVDDVQQETWLAAITRPPRSDADPRPWLAALVRNFARRAWRSNARRTMREEAAARREALPATDDVVERSMLLRDVAEAVLALPPRERELVVLRYYDGLAPREISARLGIPAAMVRRRLSRALAELRASLDARHGGRREAWSVGVATFAGQAVLELVSRPATPASAASAPSALSYALMSTKTSLTLASALVVALGVALWRGSTDPRVGVAPEAMPPGTRLATASDEASSSTLASIEPSASDRAAVPADPTSVHNVSGRVVDPAGQPLAGVGVWIGAEEDPFGPAVHAPRQRLNYWTGRTLVTDDAGVFAASFDGPRHVGVAIWRSERWEPDSASRDVQWVDTPADDIVLVVRVIPTARLTVRAHDSTTGQGLTNFRLAVVGDACQDVPRREVGQTVTYEHGFYSCGATGDVAELELRVDDSAGRDVCVFFSRPEPEGLLDAAWRALRSSPPPSVQRSLRLLPGEHVELDFEVAFKNVASGRVVDANGAPIANATVFAGDEALLRGDEPFQPFHPDRLSGVPTDADGTFRLPLDGEWITAWHREHGPTTVRRQDSARIVLPSLGSIRGLVADAPSTGALVKLDGERETRTGNEGRFEFDGVEPGVRGVALEDGRVFAVRVEPGATTNVSLAHGLERVELTLTSDGAPVDRSIIGGLIGLGDVARLYEIQHSRPSADDHAQDVLTERSWTTDVEPGASIVLRDVLPGRYLLVTTEGLLAEVEVAGERVSVELGRADLTVHAGANESLQIVPVDASPFARLAAARLAARADETGLLHLGPMQPGNYVLVGEAGRARAQVDVRGPGTEIDLR